MMQGKRALVVDDSKSARVVLSRMLEKYGIEVDSAESAETALEYLKDHHPDVIFMDHLMPGMDGLQAVREIKANPELASIPVMMYTSQEGEIYGGQARASGRDRRAAEIHPADRRHQGALPAPAAARTPRLPAVRARSHEWRWNRGGNRAHARAGGILRFSRARDGRGDAEGTEHRTAPLHRLELRFPRAPDRRRNCGRRSPSSRTRPRPPRCRRRLRARWAG